MLGVFETSGAERIARLDEGLTVIDRLLRADHEPFSGQFTSYQVAGTAPGPVQQPRPPITVAAHGPRAIDIAAQHADMWSTYGGLGVEFEELATITRARNDALNAACEAVGRDPSSIGRSIIPFPHVLDPWDDPDKLLRFVDALLPMQLDEIVFYWPQPHQRAGFERTSLEVLPQLR